MNRLVSLLKSAVLLAVVLAVPRLALAVTDNSGLGPFGIRSLFPPALPFLDFTPDQARTIPESSFRITYQYAVANTFFNTETPNRPDLPDPITQADVERGLTPDDFQPTGYGFYIDVEAERHMFAMRYGLKDDLELGLDLAWITFGPGRLDHSILTTEKLFKSVNQDLTVFEQGQFAYYMTYNGKFIHATSEPFQMEPQDPVMSLKWNVGEGGDFLPAFSLKFAYKVPLDSNPEPPASIINSGEPDASYSLIFTKRFGPLVTHFQTARSQVNDPERRFERARSFRMFAMELQPNEDFSFVGQIVSQTRLFKRPVDQSPTSKELNFSRPTDLVSLGVKYGREGFRFSTGFVEDFNSSYNETDIVLFLELGWQW